MPNTLEPNPNQPLATQSPDAELLQTHAELMTVRQEEERVAQRMRGLSANQERAFEGETDALVNRWSAALEKLAATPARTVAGVMAKAEVLRSELADATGKGCYGGDKRHVLAWSLATDVLTPGTAASAPGAGNPDARLIALCVEYQRQHNIGHAPNTPEWEEALKKSWEIAWEIADTSATTEAGRRAKAAVAARLLEVEDRRASDCQIALAVLRDLAGNAEAAA